MMDKAYNPAQHEDEISGLWEASGFYTPENLPGDRTEPFSIVLPPPNATGTLHLGHAMYVLQDVMIRHARMQGKKTLWLPGTDHAAIATQSKVESMMYAAEGKTRHDVGREELLRRIDAFVEESKSTINNQLRKMGFSLDWTRERFTLDPGLVHAVQTMFIQMANDGLVYRGDRVVNWDPKLHTTVADDEMEYKEEKAPFYYFQYGPFVIGTVRPETKFGDKYVVMHPDDERYAAYRHGDTLEVEWINGPITATIIKDEAVDPAFGSGVMTITPWHTPTDFEIAQRHGLDKEQIIDLDGNLLPVAGEFAGTHIEEARPKIVEKLKAKGLLVKIDEEYLHSIAVSYRGGGKIEPQIMKQWFVAVDKPVVAWKGKTQTLKEVALDVVREGDIQIVPDRFNKTYEHWMENLHDWCISRQLWYGHRIPAWYHSGDAAREKPVVQIDSPGADYTQDEDVLDTWFSSGMWTFSTLGWPQKSKDLNTFHPTDVLETGYDILFFWVARMILMTTYGMGEIPFRKVYLHGLVRDKFGQKMSKSKGNGIDPLEMTAKYGTDAVRMSLVTGTTPGNDVRLYEEKIANFRNFVNKLWNVSRFVVMNEASAGEPSRADRWILSRLHALIRDVDRAYADDQYGQACDRLYGFVWHEFADWYIEMSKLKTVPSIKQREVLGTVLKLLHPVIPFVTEVVAKEAGMVMPHGMLMVDEWPHADESMIDPALDKRFDAIQQIVTDVRNLRREYRIAPGRKLEVLAVDMPEEDTALIAHLARVHFVPEKSYTTAAHLVSGEQKFIIPLDGVIDVEKEKQRLATQMVEVEKHIASIADKLNNEKFMQNARADIVDQTRDLHAQRETELQQLKKSLEALS